MGGEKIPANAPPLCPVGSPPRGRGKGCGGSGCCRWLRITPAWAGKRATPTKTGCPGGDHPRVGGEKSLSYACHLPSSGSPPRGRGKGEELRRRMFDERITPAWAGKSLFVQESVSCISGSPPRGRGKVIKHLVQQLHGGITPAWAGKSRERWPQCWPRWDHPRVGGEKQRPFMLWF